MIETLIVPGLNGSPPGHWQHHWALEDAGADLVEQENFAEPRLTDWLHALEAGIAACRPGVILVAHSLGCALVAALARRPAASHVGGALLVAPADVPALGERFPSVRSFEGAGAAPKAPVAPARKPRTLETKALETLGVPHNAGAEAIRVQYKALVKQYHPDSNAGDRSSEDRLREVIQAYKLLKQSGFC